MPRAEVRGQGQPPELTSVVDVPSTTVAHVTQRQRISYAVVSWLLSVLLGALALYITAQLTLDRLTPGWFWVLAVAAGLSVAWFLYALYQLVRWGVGEIFGKGLDHGGQVV